MCFLGPYLRAARAGSGATVDFLVAVIYRHPRVLAHVLKDRIKQLLITEYTQHNAHEFVLRKDRHKDQKSTTAPLQIHRPRNHYVPAVLGVLKRHTPARIGAQISAHIGLLPSL